jgi:hypothetical protein
VEGKKWYRFPHYISPSYFYMSESSWDAVDFVPSKTIMFIGFMFYMHKDKKDFTLTWKFKVDEEDGC